MKQREREREREREGGGGEGECDFLSGPPNHLYSLATPINYLVHFHSQYLNIIMQDSWYMSHSNFHYSILKVIIMNTIFSPSLTDSLTWMVCDKHP